VLDSPFGRMLKPTVDDMVKNNMNRKAGLLGIAGEKVGAKATPETSEQRAAAVKIAKTSKELDEILSLASGGCAIIFFTSYTCAPCRILYPLYDQLAAEAAHKGTFIKVDIAISQDIAQRYSIGSTPTFVTFLRGEPENRWSGADAGTLRGNVKVLLQMAWPPHPHESLRMPAMHAATMNPILYGKVPPLEKLLSKMGDSATNPAVQGVKHFVEARSTEGAAEVTLPNLDAFSWFIRGSIQNLPPEVMFTIVDLLRAAMFDSRFSGYYAEEKDHKTIAPLFGYVNSQSTCPYALRLVALQTGCNLFSSPLYIEHILSCPTLTRPIVQLITTSLLDDKHHVVRVAAASLSFNIASANSKLRTEEHREGLADADQVELVASLLEAIGAEEESAEALKGLLLAFGYLVYCLPKDGELVDLLQSMDAHRTVTSRRKFFPKEPLISEIGNELLGKGL
jgi:thiol-disulfide isomerase/thioredoxin